MFDLTKRPALPIIGCTPENVGADTYVICDGNDLRKSFAPFACEAERKFNLGSRSFTDALYNVVVPKRTIGGSSLKSKAKRFVYKESDTPGPADYDVKKPAKCKFIDQTPIPGMGKLYVCKVPLTVGVSAPAIPTHLDENGYDIDENNLLIKIPANSRHGNIGPTSYDVPNDICTSCSVYKGCKWSASKSQRDTYRITENPAPGTYDSHVKKTVNVRDEAYREMARRLTYLPRYTEGYILRLQAENGPGPGDYDLKSRTLKCESKGIKPRPFLTAANRFEHLTTDTPSPCEYNVNICQKWCPSINEPPFSVGAPRFPKKTIAKIPGPGDYDVKSSVSRCKNRLTNKYVPFNQTGKRVLNEVPLEDQLKPSPATYNMCKNLEENTPIYHSSFKCKVNRIIYAAKDGPDTASYNVVEAFRKNHSRTSHYTGNLPFQSSGPRSVLFRNLDNPSPTKYSVHKEMDDKGFYFNTTPRFTSDDQCTPGPGTYKIEQKVDAGCAKAIQTFNTRLQMNLLRRFNKKLPKHTYKLWRDKLKLKKLRWFEEPLIYDHCPIAKP